MFRIEIKIIDDSIPRCGMDDPAYVRSFNAGSSYRKLALAEKFALRIAELANVNESRITGKRR